MSDLQKRKRWNLGVDGGTANLFFFSFDLAYLDRTPLASVPDHDFTPAGTLTQRGKMMPFLHEITTKIRRSWKGTCRPLVKHRRLARKAKAKLEGLAHIQRKFPHFTLRDLDDMRSQFISYDLNHDGLIDYPELDRALDELGDDTPSDIRRKCFDEIDVDKSDSVDFEEFLGLIKTVSAAGGGGGGLEALFRKGREQNQVGRWIPYKRMRTLGLI